MELDLRSLLFVQ